jgi:hypothetical protein
MPLVRGDKMEKLGVSGNNSGPFDSMRQSDRPTNTTRGLAKRSSCQTTAVDSQSDSRMTALIRPVAEPVTAGGG